MKESLSVRALDQRLQNVAGKDQTLAYRLRVTVANVVVGQMLPAGAVKGGTAMKIRLGEGGSRFTPDLGDADDPVYLLAHDIGQLFADVGLPLPGPIPVMRADHQIAQKLHACTGAGNERAHDLVDLQLLVSSDELDLAQVRETSVRLFKYRQAQPWPPTVVAGPTWRGIYDEAGTGLEVVPNVDSAVDWVNELIARIDNAT